MLRFGLFVGAVVCTTCISNEVASAQRRYSVTAVPDTEYAWTSGRALNESGHVVGYALSSRSGPPDAPAAAFYWSPSTGVLTIGPQVSVTGLNNHDVVVGFSPQRPEAMRALWWNPRDRVLEPVPEVPTDGGAAGPLVSEAHGVNDAGQIGIRTMHVGTFDPRSYVREPDGTLRPLPDPGTGGRWSVSAINGRGDAAGEALFDTSYKAVRWPAGGAGQRLADLTRGASQSRDINASGQVVGIGYSEGQGNLALLWDADGAVRDLGTLAAGDEAVAYGINDHGEVVGASGESVGAGPNRAFLWTAGEGMLDLNTLLDASGTGYVLHEAYSVNNRGQILANARLNNGPPVALVLTPVPEPGAAGVLCVVAAMGQAIARRARPRRSPPRGVT